MKVGTRFLTEEGSYRHATGEGRANPVVAWIGTGGIDVNAYFSRSMRVHMYVHLCVSYISSLRGSESSKTPVARNTLKSHVLVSKRN